MTENTKIVTVLTGDLVNSTALGAEKVEMAFERLKEVAKDLEAWHGGSLLFTRHRGDGWQVVLREPRYAVRSALVFRTALKALDGEIDTYIAMIDGIFTLTDSEDLNSYLDFVFIQSGKLLEILKRDAIQDRRMRFAGSRTDETSDNEIVAISSLLDYMANGWTKAQCASLFWFLVDPEISLSDVGEKIGISRQAVKKSLEGAGYPYLSSTLIALEFSDD